ncbi:MAG: ABC transporter substrate-binding protein, partial [Mycobacteriaceae bacterium]
MKRRVALAAILSAGLFAAAGCAGGSSSNQTDASPQHPLPYPKGKVQLTMWWWGEQEVPGAKKWLAETVSDYHAKHKNVTIKTVLQTTDGLIPAFQAAAAAKQGPDIQYFWGGIYSQQPYWKQQIKPVSDYIPASELKHYTNASLEDSNQGKVVTAPWYVNPQFPVLVRNDILTKYGLKAPTTWPDFLHTCDVLNGHGVTTIAGGVKDGWFGGWLYSMLGGQSVSSQKDVTAAVVGDQSFTDPQHSDWWKRLEETRQHHCWNNDINSLELYQAQQRWVSGDAAMTITAGTDAANFVNKVGADKVT